MYSAPSPHWVSPACCCLCVGYNVAPRHLSRGGVNCLTFAKLWVTTHCTQRHPAVNHHQPGPRPPPSRFLLPLCPKIRSIGVQPPCAMCNRSHFLFQKYSFSSNHSATKVQSCAPTSIVRRTFHNALVRLLIGSSIYVPLISGALSRFGQIFAY